MLQEDCLLKNPYMTSLSLEWYVLLSLACEPHTVHVGFDCRYLCCAQVEEIKRMKIGDPLDRSTDHGPQNHKAHLDKLVEYCEIGVKEGATLVYGGKQVDRPGETSDTCQTR